MDDERSVITKDEHAGHEGVSRIGLGAGDMEQTDREKNPASAAADNEEKVEAINEDSILYRRKDLSFVTINKGVPETIVDRVMEEIQCSCSTDLSITGGNSSKVLSSIKPENWKAEDICENTMNDVKSETESKSLIHVPEYDAELNHVFFAKKSLCEEDQAKEEEMRLKFFSTYKAFFNNRQDLINTLRDIADEVIHVQKSCNISHIVGGSVGMVGGATALIGTAAFPPLLFGGLALAGLASVSNLGTTIAQFLLFRNLVQSASKKSKYDVGLMENLEDVYRALILSNLFDIQEHLPNGEIKKNFPMTKLQLGLDSAKSGALALGLQSVGIGMVEISSGLLRGVARSAVGIGVVIDGVTIYISANDLAKGCSTSLSDAIRKLADNKEAELELVKKKVSLSGLFDASYKPSSVDSYLVLSRSKMASVL